MRVRSTLPINLLGPSHSQTIPSRLLAKLRKKADEFLERGQQECETGEGYVKLTVFLATVLFLVAIAQRFTGRAPQLLLLGVGAVATLIVLVMLMISHVG